MSTRDHARRTSGTRQAAAPAAALAAVVACVVLGLALLALRVTVQRLDRVHPIASHRASALDPRHVLRVYDEVDRRARGLPPDERASVARAILEESAGADLAPALVLAVIHVESGFRHRAASPAGALGLMQLKPSTMHRELARARIRGADPLDPVANVRAGVRYLGRLVRAFDDVELALIAYNAGPRRLRRHLADGQIPERFLKYPQLVRRHAERHAASSRSARRPAPAIALAPAHGPGRPRASWAATGGTPAPLAATAGVASSAPATSRTGARRLDADPGALPPVRHMPREMGPPHDALARRPFRSRHHA